MKKFILMCLMAFMVCSCNNSNKTPIIKTDKIVGYSAKVLFDDVIPTTIGSTFVYEYNENGRLTSFRVWDSDNFLYHTQTAKYDKDKLVSLTRTFQLSSDHDKNEYVWYKKESKWFKSTNGEVEEIVDVEDIDWLENYKQGYTSFLNINADNTFVMQEDEEVYGFGKVTEYDVYGNWTKAIG